MSFAEEIQNFNKTHPYAMERIDGVDTKYLSCGKNDAAYTLVYLVGGTGFSEAWFHHILSMETDYRVVTLDYPMEIKDLERLADHVMTLLDKLAARNPVLIGASLGGFLSQLIARRYADRITAVVLYSTCGLLQSGIEDLKKQYKSYGLLLKAMKIIPYSWIKRLLFSISKKQVGMENEAPADRAYMVDFFGWVYGRYTKEFDLHMTGLIVDVANLSPFTLAEYARFDGKSLLVLPKADKAFSENAQADLLRAMPRAKVVRADGGHTATLYRVEQYVRETKNFLAHI